MAPDAKRPHTWRSTSQGRERGARVSNIERRTSLLQTEVDAECLFVDPVADVAVLGEPDVAAYPDEWQAFVDFVDGYPPLRVSEEPPSSVWVLGLDGAWHNAAR